MLSVDIGKIHLGFAIITDDLIIGLFNTETGEFNSSIPFQNFVKTRGSKESSTVLKKAQALKFFIDSVFEKFEIKELIIERQSQFNRIAQELEYILVGLCFEKVKIKIFNPINKFKWLGLEYSTKNKQHKKLSVEIMTRLIDRFECKDFFKEVQKKDDIADAVFMGFLMKDLEFVRQFIKC